MTIIRTVPEVEATGDVAAIYALRLRDVGFSDREIVDITIAASARLYLGSALRALAVDVDVPERLSEPLRSALVEGL
jgi:hypothetical protein